MDDMIDFTNTTQKRLYELAWDKYMKKRLSMTKHKRKQEIVKNAITTRLRAKTRMEIAKHGTISRDDAFNISARYKKKLEDRKNRKLKRNMFERI